jgi:hypothetical protein
MLLPILLVGQTSDRTATIRVGNATDTGTL